MWRNVLCHTLLRWGLALLIGVLLPVLPFLAVANAQSPATIAGQPDVLLATSFGAKGDLRTVGELTFTAGSRTAKASIGTFRTGDVGKTVTGVTMGPEGTPVSATSQIVSVAAGGAEALLVDESRVSLKGVSGGIGTDNAEALQRCWDASAAKGLVCWISAGQYLFASRPLVIRSHMSVEGGAPEQTALVCAPSIRDCVGLDDGPVQFVSIQRLGLSGTEGDLAPPRDNKGAQRGFHLVAHGAGGAAGGLWQSSFSHVEVSGFWGDEFVLEGGVGEYNHPNQFLFFDDLELQAARGAPGIGPPPDSYRLRLIGQNAQIMFSGGQVHGSIGSQLGNGVLIDGAGVVLFEGVTCEWLDGCLDVRKGNSIRFTDGWIENVKRVAALGEGGVRAFTLDHSYLANSCYDGHHGGACVRIASAKADTGVSFAHNSLAWSTAPPDSVVAAPAGAVVDQPGTLMNGAARAGGAGPTREARTATGNDGWRKAMGTSAWIAPGATGTLHLEWSPAPFPSEDFTASCVLYGAAGALQLHGIVRQGVHDLDVAIANRDPRSQGRATVHCVGTD